MSAPMPPEQRRSELVALRAALADAHARLHTSEIQRDAWTDAAQRAMKALAAAEQVVRDLRDCLKELAYPDEGWPHAHIADTFERSRRLVPDLPTPERSDA